MGMNCKKGLVVTAIIGSMAALAYMYLKNNPEVLEEIEKKVRDNFAKAFEQSLGEELPSDDEEDTEPIDEE